MPRLKQQRNNRFEKLTKDGVFFPWEAIQLSRLPMRTHALRALIAFREEKRVKFNKEADRKQWSPREYAEIWKNRIDLMYRRRHAMIKGERQGAQEKVAKAGKPNIWALYRKFEQLHPSPDDYKSPWEKKKMTKTDKKLSYGMVMVQKAKGGSVSNTTIRSWIDQLDINIETAIGQRREELMAQRAALKRQL